MLKRMTSVSGQLEDAGLQSQRAEYSPYSPYQDREFIVHGFIAIMRARMVTRAGTQDVHIIIKVTHAEENDISEWTARGCRTAEPES